jgi:hypothetical protein
MLFQLALGSVVITVTVTVFAGFIAVALDAHDRARHWLVTPPVERKSILVLVIVTLWTLAGLTVAVWIWSAVFLVIGEFSAAEPAVYFALVVFTTLGFGDIVQETPWRLLSGMCPANGLLLFGLGTAFLVEFLQRMRDARDR